VGIPHGADVAVSGRQGGIAGDSEHDGLIAH
jgi:hypothetical protein